MFDFLNKKLVPLKIVAKVIFPQEVMDEVEKWKKEGKDINQEDSFLRVEKNPLKFNFLNQHAGFANLINDKTVELTYGKEGYWFQISPNEISKLEGYEDYHYNFEDGHIKSKFLIDIKIIDWIPANDRGDGRINTINNEYCVEFKYLGKKYKFYTSYSNLSNIKKQSNHIIKDIDNNLIKDIEFINNNNIDKIENIVNPSKKVEGKFNLNDGKEVEFFLSCKRF